MSLNNQFTASELAGELDAGQATVRYLLNRFRPWLPYIFENGQELYNTETLKTLFFIREKVNSGMMPSEIETALDKANLKFLERIKNTCTDSDKGMDGLPPDITKLLSTFVENFTENHGKIARAQEKKADAEQKKAMAMARRAEAEEQKTLALDNLANAVNRLGNELFRQKIFEMPPEKMSYEKESKNELSSSSDHSALKNKENEFYNKSDIEKDVETQKSSPDMGALSRLIDDGSPSTDTDEIPNDLEDLLNLINEDLSEETNKIIEADADELSDIFKESSPDKTKRDTPPDMDDLSLLIDDGPGSAGTEKAPDMDDLSLLIDDEQGSAGTEKAPDMDDLSLLIDDEQGSAGTEKAPDMDDLSLLIDDEQGSAETQKDPDMDDLSLLIDDEQGSAGTQKDPDMDDLSLLIDGDLYDKTTPEKKAALSSKKSDKAKTSKQIPEKLKPTVSPEEDFKTYKAQIINLIIKLKSDRHNVEETTQLLNNEGIQTLSGKNKWNPKMIAKIYQFIESAVKQ